MVNISYVVVVRKKKYVLKALLETFSESPTSLATSY